MREDGAESVPPAGTFQVKAFAAAFTEDEVPGEPADSRPTVVLTAADGSTRRDTHSFGPPIETEENAATGCYRDASLNADTAAPGGAGTPLEICDRFWNETGFVGEKRPSQLVACEGRGATSVFPGGPGTCEKLGLRPR